MGDPNADEPPADGDGEEAEISQAVETLIEIAVQLRELADYAASLSDEPIFEPTLH